MVTEELVDFVAPYTSTTKERRAAMLKGLRQIETLPGDIVECGVWQGGNIILARKVLPDRVCWLYDTFSGMTAPGPEDKRRGGYSAAKTYENKRAAGLQWCGADLGKVRGCLEQTDTLDDSKLRFVVGDVGKTLLNEKNLPDQIALLRLDTDWYASTKVELEVLYPRLVSGGVLIIDDYGHWQGARKAVDNYFGAGFRFKWIDYAAIMMTKP